MTSLSTCHLGFFVLDGSHIKCFDLFTRSNFMLVSMETKMARCLGNVCSGSSCMNHKYFVVLP